MCHVLVIFCASKLSTTFNFGINTEKVIFEHYSNSTYTACTHWKKNIKKMDIYRKNEQKKLYTVGVSSAKLFFESLSSKAHCKLKNFMTKFIIMIQDYMPSSALCFENLKKLLVEIAENFCVNLNGSHFMLKKFMMKNIMRT